MASPLSTFKAWLPEQKKTDPYGEAYNQQRAIKAGAENRQKQREQSVKDVYNVSKQVVNNYINNPANSETLKRYDLSTTEGFGALMNEQIWDPEKNPEAYNNYIQVLNRNPDFVRSLNDRNNSGTKITGLEGIHGMNTPEGPMWTVSMRGEPAQTEEAGLFRGLTDAVGMTVPLTEKGTADPNDFVKQFTKGELKRMLSDFMMANGGETFATKTFAELHRRTARDAQNSNPPAVEYQRRQRQNNYPNDARNVVSTGFPGLPAEIKWKDSALSQEQTEEAAYKKALMQEEAANDRNEYTTDENTITAALKSVTGKGGKLPTDQIVDKIDSVVKDTDLGNLRGLALFKRVDNLSKELDASQEGSKPTDQQFKMYKMSTQRLAGLKEQSIIQYAKQQGFFKTGMLELYDKEWTDSRPEEIDGTAPFARSLRLSRENPMSGNIVAKGKGWGKEYLRLLKPNGEEYADAEPLDSFPIGMQEYIRKAVGEAEDPVDTSTDSELLPIHWKNKEAILKAADDIRKRNLGVID
jgi:hypothetical protein